MILLEQSFITIMFLLMSTSTCGLGKRS